ncbi:hypothetical protein AAG906_013182 [Vitis piasezkii]
MKLKSRIFCRYGSPTIIHPKTSPNVDESTFKCTHRNTIDPTNLDIPQFQSNNSWYDRKTMRNRGFEPWTFRLCLGYQHFVINDNNRDQRKKDSKKTSIASSNGNTTPVIGEGSLTLTDTLNLDSVLVVPSLDYNLLTSKQDRRLVVVLSGENSITWTCSQRIQINCNKP